MLTFIRESFRELEHVVWPTQKESRTYMWYTVAIIVVMTVYLAAIGYVFQTALKATRHALNDQAGQNLLINEQDLATQEDLQNIVDSLNLSGSSIEIAPDSGEVISENIDAETPALEIIPELDATPDQNNAATEAVTPESTPEL